MPSVLCPICKAQTEYSTSNPFRPFCSERCKLIDLGEWASEKYRVADSAEVDPLELLQAQLPPQH
ncbi:DNA gyrase inhibitor YacG [Chitinibacter tainanensis]|uniref:DNA gyrase inhibitor YacG n=1 Tax=Chitinibacter tainanensis TaxID=230667 RepID=UPI0003F73093|nr:DNA gyrase inhibitor YacG [Chitinibacter tainanensis]